MNLLGSISGLFQIHISFPEKPELFVVHTRNKQIVEAPKICFSMNGREDERRDCMHRALVLDFGVHGESP